MISPSLDLHGGGPIPLFYNPRHYVPLHHALIEFLNYVFIATILQLIFASSLACTCFMRAGIRSVSITSPVM